MKIKTEFVTNSSSTSFIIADMRENKDEPIWVEDDVGTKFNILILENTDMTNKLKDPDTMIDIVETNKIEYCKSLVSEERAVLRYLVAHEGGHIISVGVCSLGINELKFPDNVQIIKGEGGD